MEDFEERFIKPIRNASYPATVATLSLTVSSRLQASGIIGVPTIFLLGAAAFLLSSFCIFFYSLYPTRKPLWTVSAISFLVGLFWLVISVFVLFFA
jgi:hypothetical protein